MTAATAILMIDVQKTYLDQARRDALGWPPIWRLGEVVEECSQLLAAGRAAGIPVIYTRAVRRPDGADVTPRMLRMLASVTRDGAFSADGRHFAIRGNAYGNTLAVFEFPSLRRVLANTLGDPSPGYPYPQEWLDRMRAWSRHNIAFGARPEVLWVGTPTGSLIELDIPTGHATAHDVLVDARMTALCATAAGNMLAATDRGELAYISVAADPATVHATNAASPQALAAAFLESTSDVPLDGTLEAHLALTDGDRTWEQEDLETVTSVTTADPSWLQIQAAMNAYKQKS